MAAFTAPDRMNQPVPEQARPADMSSSFQQLVINAQHVNAPMMVGNQNVMKKNDTSYPQVHSDSGSDSSRPTSPKGTHQDDYVTSKTRALVALCSTKDIPVRFLLMIVEFARNKVPSPQDSYRSEIIDSFDLEFDPFEPRHQNKSFNIPKKCNKLVKDILGSTRCQEIARKEGILDLAELYSNVFCVKDDKRWHLQQQLLPHLDRWFSLVEENNLNSSLSAYFLTMCLHAFGKFRWTGWEDRLKNLCEKCLEQCKDALGNKRKRMLREIGETYRKLSNYTEAEKYLEMALDVHETSPSVDESLPYQISRMFFARCKIDMGEYQAAHDLMKSCLDNEAVQNLKPKRPYLRCRMYFEMARSCEKLGKFGDAYQYCTKALKDDMREDGFRYPQYLMYAAFYKAMSTVDGNVSEAVLNDVLADCSKADSILRERHGEDHHHRAHVLCIQARIWLSKNDPKEALRRAKRACHITKKRYGYEHIKVAKMFDLLGDIHKVLNNDEKAWEAYWMAKNMYSERQHSRSDDIEQKLANMSKIKTCAPKCTKRELFEELLV